MLQNKLCAPSSHPQTSRACELRLAHFAGTRANGIPFLGSSLETGHTTASGLSDFERSEATESEVSVPDVLHVAPERLLSSRGTKRAVLPGLPSFLLLEPGHET